MAGAPSTVASADQEFCVEVDARGNIISIESGSIAAIPERLLAMVTGIVSTDLPHRTFFWMEAGSTDICHVSIDPQSSRTTDPSVTITGLRVFEFPYGLTRRELDVLTLLTVGMSNVEIAERLVLSPRTVTTHVDHVVGKMGVSSRTAAAAIALDEGLMRVPFPGGVNGFDRLGLGRALDGNRASGADRAGRPRPVRKPLVIGAALPLTGQAAADGFEMAQATQLGIDEVNRRGGIDGRKVSMEIVDVDILNAESTRIALSALASHGVDVITSGYFAHQDVAHELMADLGIPYLHTTTMLAMEERVKAQPDRYGNIFQVCPSDSHYAPRFVEVMTELRNNRQWLPSSNRLLVVQSAWDLSDFGAEAATKVAGENSWTLDVIRPADETKESWKSVAESIRRTEPAAVMVGHYLVEGAVTFLNEFLQDGSDTLVYLVYAPSVPEFRERLGQRADGILWATVTGTYSDPIAKAFALRYQAQYGRHPGRSQAGIAYDRVQVIAQAWSRVSNPRDSSSVCSELRRVVHRGVSGVYYFGEPGQAAKTYLGLGSDPSLTQAHLVFQIQDGHDRIISPGPYAEKVFIPPVWLRRTREHLGITQRPSP